MTAARSLAVIVALALLSACAGPCDPAATGRAHWAARAISRWTGPLIGATTGGLLTLGGGREQRTGRYAVDALVVDTAVIEALKSSLRRSRPDAPEAKDGMPSGHASAAFTLAAALGNRHPGTRAFAYPAAAAVAWSRVELGRHTWGQVIAGAGIGVLIGTASARSRGGLLNGSIVDRNAPTSAFAGSDGGDFVAQRMLWSRQW